MKYLSGQDIKLHDQVQLWKDKCGIVVCIIEDSLFSHEFPQADWAFLQKGLLVNMDDGQFIHYPEIDEDLTFVVPQ